MGAPRTKEHLLELAKEFEKKVVKTKPHIIVDLSSYQSLKHKVTYFCKDHNFTGSTTASVLLRALGCPQCRKEKTLRLDAEYKAEVANKNYKRFLEEAFKLHGDKYTYHNDYVCSRTKIRITCIKHNEDFYQLPSAHLQGQGCPLCGAESAVANTTTSDEDFEAKWLSFNKNTKLSYVKNSFTKYHDPVSFFCEEHGEFTTNSGAVFKESVCKLCNKEHNRKLAEQKFLEKSKRLYPDQFDYSLMEYKDNRSKVTLICRDHGEIQVSVMHHLSELGHGSGCIECGKLLMGRWSPKVLSKDKKYFKTETCRVYLLKIEDFYKIGITKYPKARYATIEDESGFKVQELGYFESNTFYSSQIEHYLAKVFKSRRFKHDIHFGGYTECYRLGENEVSFILTLFSMPETFITPD